MGDRKRATGLGRGLSALLGDIETVETARAEGAVETLPIASIVANQLQPRKYFDADQLDELTKSVKEHGVLQPILVRPIDGGKYEIIAGERRWRAAQAAGLHAVPAIRRNFNDAVSFEIALIENIQRADLNPIEEAEGYRRLIAEFGHSAEELGRLVHKSRSHVANLLRLLELPDSVREWLMEGQISMGHARALITANHPTVLAEEVIKRGLSVRQTEALARSRRDGGRVVTGAKRPVDADIAALERQLSDVLGLKVAIQHDGAGGRISVAYGTLDQLDMLCQRLTGERF